MGDGKSLPLLGGIGFFLFLPLLIVIAMLFTSMGALGNAAECAPTMSEGKAFGWPTEEHEPSQGWDDDGEEQHKGLDYSAGKGSPVRAAEDGEVVSTDGDWIKIRHGEGIQTWYEFFDAKKVQVGDHVKRGDEIGTVGEGDEDAPGKDGAHLHFEMRVEGQDGDLESQDPTDQIGEASSESSGDGCSCGGGPLVGSNNQQKAFNYFASNGYSREQAAGIVGNMIHESGVEPARLQSTAPGTVTHPSAAVNSSAGWGIVQWTPAGKMIRPSMNATDNDEAKVESLEWQLDFLHKQLEGQGPLPEGEAGRQLKASHSVGDAAYAFGRYFERFAGSENPNDPEFNERRTTAQEVFDTFAGSGTATGTGGCGAGNGNIVQTALSLAWDTPGHGKNRSDAKPSYQDAMPKYNGATDYDPYSDCGVFVATVMVMSGVDKDYVRRLTTAQREYVRNSSKYVVFENLNSVDQLKPGDVFVHGGHTFIYTGNYEGGDGETYNAASASLGDHVPEATHVYFSDSRGHYTVARIKQAGAGGDG
jgi:Phage tail lysozyme/Peptidase family M23